MIKFAQKAYHDEKARPADNFVPDSALPLFTG
jgi:hypothetical protein